MRVAAIKELIARTSLVVVEMIMTVAEDLVLTENVLGTLILEDAITGLATREALTKLLAIQTSNALMVAAGNNKILI